MQTLTRVVGFFGICASLSLTACAPATAQLTGAAVEGAVETVEDRETLRRIEQIAASPEFQSSVEDLGAAMVRGVGRGATEYDLEGGLEQMTASAVRGVVGGVREGLGELPDARGIVDDAISGALASASSERNRAHARLVATDITQAMVRSMTASFAAGIDEDLRPTLAQMSEQASPMLATALADDDLRLAIGTMIHEVSRQSALGVDQAMADIRANNRAEQQGILGRTSMIGWAVFAALGILLLGAIIAIIVLAVANSRSRRAREQLLTSVFASYAAREGGVDEGTRAALLRQLGVDSPPPKPPAQSEPSPGPQVGPSGLIPATE